MINVSKTYLPDKERYKAYIDKIYESGWVTNNGALVKELEERLKNYLGVKHLILVANGTLALQVAYKALGLNGEVITAPFSFVATTSSLVWGGLQPVFADIDPATFNIDTNKIENLITRKTSAIVPVHVFGNACEIEEIQSIADKHNLKVVYDAAHAFGVNYKEKSILNYGDISTLSFHATKLFHTIEGGAVITNDDAIAKKIRLLINFGLMGSESIDGLGTNAKMNEFEAAMGLCILDDIEDIIKNRKLLCEYYEQELKDKVIFQKQNTMANQNYGYMPVLFETEEKLLNAQKALNDINVYPRRYFYPSLDTLKYVKSKETCSVSNNIASRILCLPIYHELEKKFQDMIIKRI